MNGPVTPVWIIKIMVKESLATIYATWAEKNLPLNYLLPEAQRAAKQRWQESGWPSIKATGWRHTNYLPSAPRLIFGPLVKKNLRGHNKKQLIFPQAWTVVVVNGVFSPQLSTLSDLPPGVIIKSFIDTPPELLGNFFNQTIASKNYGWATLNTMLMRDGLFILVPSQTSLKRPIHLQHIFMGSGQMVIQPRFLAVMEKKSTADIIISCEVVGRGQPFINKVDEVILAEDSVVNVLTMATDVNLKLVAEMAAQVGGRSRLNSFTVNRGGNFIRLSEQVRLSGQGATVDLSGFYERQLAGQAETIVSVEHTASQTTSAILYKGLAQGTARTFFRGEVVVVPGQQAVKSTLHNKNILLSESAQMRTEPYLKIFSDDVQCTHGATVGEFPVADIFYLRSRGLSQQRAKQLLKTAFINDILNRVPICAIGQPLESLLKS